MAERIRAVEEVHLVPRTRQPAPGLATAVASWARGASFSTALGVAARDVGRAGAGRLRAHHEVRGRPGPAGLAHGRRTRRWPRPPARPSTSCSGASSPAACRAADPIRHRRVTLVLWLAGHVPLLRRALHRGRGGRPPALRHQPRPAGVCPGQPARGGQGSALRPLLALAQEPAPALPRRVRRGPRRLGRRHGRRHGRPGARRAALREGLRRVRRRLGGAARRRPPRLRAVVQRAVEGARVGTAHGLPRAVDALHRVQPAARERSVPLLPPARDPRLAARGPLRRRDGPRVRHLRRAAARACRPGWRSASPNRPATATSCTARRPAPSRSTRCADCCRRRRCRTSASTGPASPTSSCCCACARTRCPRPATTPT